MAKEPTMDHRMLCPLLLLLGPALAAGAQERTLDQRLDEYEKQGPTLGKTLASLRFHRLAGGEASLEDFLAAGPVVIEAVSLSNPEARQRADREALVAAYAERGVQFLIVVTREENAGRRLGVHDFRSLRDARSLEDRRQLARRFAAESPTAARILIDPVDNATWRALGRVPNPSIVLAPDGTILFREAWASAEGIRFALDEVFAGGFDRLRLAAKDPEPEPEPDKDKEREGDRRWWDRDRDAKYEYEDFGRFVSRSNDWLEGRMGRGLEPGIREDIRKRLDQMERIGEALDRLPPARRDEHLEDLEEIERLFSTAAREPENWQKMKDLLDEVERDLGDRKPRGPGGR